MAEAAAGVGGGSSSGAPQLTPPPPPAGKWRNCLAMTFGVLAFFFLGAAVGVSNAPAPSDAGFLPPGADEAPMDILAPAGGVQHPSGAPPPPVVADALLAGVPSRGDEGEAEEGSDGESPMPTNSMSGGGGTGAATTGSSVESSSGPDGMASISPKDGPMIAGRPDVVDLPAHCRDSIELPENGLMEYSPYNITVKKSMPDEAVAKCFFSNILAVIMMSPSRYHLVDTVRAHYEPFFTHMYFCGPHNDTNHTTEIHGYDIAWGNQQFRAVSRIMRMYERENSIPDLEGYFYLSDDVLMQPWALVTFDRSKIWATLMGIANVKSGGNVYAVPGMSVESKFRRDWPYWKKNRGRLFKALTEAGQEYRDMLRENVRRTHPYIIKASKYDRRLLGWDNAQWGIYFTIVDTYYVPRKYALRYADLCDIMQPLWVFGECAIATMLRMLDWDIQTLHVQFYWSTLNAADCPRGRWGASFSGFHRCRHDHPFAGAIYNDTSRRELQHDAKYRAYMLSPASAQGWTPT